MICSPHLTFVSAAKPVGMTTKWSENWKQLKILQQNLSSLSSTVAVFHPPFCNVYTLQHSSLTLDTPSILPPSRSVARKVVFITGTLETGTEHSLLLMGGVAHSLIRTLNLSICLPRQLLSYENFKSPLTNTEESTRTKNGWEHCGNKKERKGKN